jgi:serine/threonine protein kinase
MVFGIDQLLRSSDHNLPKIPDCQDVVEVGRGGMGVVYRAFQMRLARTVAVKVVRRGVRQEDFAHEARTAAQLRHANIVAVHDFGYVRANEPYMVMDFVEDTLGRQWEDAPPTPQDVAETVKTLAGAVHFAHCKQVVYRDLKPSNILVDELGIC